MAENNQKKIMMIAIFVAAIIIIAIILLPTPSERAILRASDLGSANYREEQFSTRITCPTGNDGQGALVRIANYQDHIGLLILLYIFYSNEDARIAMAEKAVSCGFNNSSAFDLADGAILGLYPTSNATINGETSVTESVQLFFVKGKAFGEITLIRYWVIGLTPTPTDSVTDQVVWMGTIQVEKLVRVSPANSV
jgi:hypothetical protein